MHFKITALLTLSAIANVFFWVGANHCQSEARMHVRSDALSALMVTNQGWRLYNWRKFRRVVYEEQL